VPADLLDTSVAGLAEHANRFEPAEDLFDSFAELLARCVATVSCHDLPYMAFMLNMTDSNEGFFFPHHSLITFYIVQSTYCTFSLRKFYLARLLLYKY
jgi:hypothetical protein